jgi:hypothetical protein
MPKHWNLHQIPDGSEYSAAHAEEAASAVVEMHLPEERLRIGDLLNVFPQQRETKAQKLLDGLGILWRQNPNEKIVNFCDLPWHCRFNCT